MLEQLQREAERLGVPWTHDTTEQELRAMIEARTTPGKPDKPPDCFGLVWGADVDEGCKTCRFRDPCLDRLATVTIPGLEQEAGAPLTAAELADRLQIDETSVLVALQRRSTADAVGVNPPSIPESKAPEEEPVKSEPAKTKAKAKAKPPKSNGTVSPAEAEAALAAPDPRSAGSAAPAGDPAEAHGRKSATPAAVPVPEPRNSAATSRRGKVKPGAKKSKPKSGSSTSSSTSKKKARAKPKPPKTKRQAARSGSSPWGQHTWRSRWDRERLRSPEIAALTPQTKLTQQYQGTQHTVQCRVGHYRYQGQQYPTLYSVVLAITGGNQYRAAQPGKTRRMSAWSASRFFRLRAR